MINNFPYIHDHHIEENQKELVVMYNLRHLLLRKDKTIKISYTALLGKVMTIIENNELKQIFL